MFDLDRKINILLYPREIHTEVKLKYESILNLVFFIKKMATIFVLRSKHTNVVVDHDH